MKKILVGFFGIFLVLGIVAGTGYALFSSTVSLEGVVLGTATPSLQVSLVTDEDIPYAWRTKYTSLGNIFAPLLPGEYDWGEFMVRNMSDGTTDKLAFDLTGKIASVNMDADWNALKNAVRMNVCLYDATDSLHCDNANKTGFKTLATWMTSQDLPGGELLQDEDEAMRWYTIVLYIPHTYTNTIADKTITGLNFEITGTQAL